jgi:hypothetical protein
MSAWDAVHAAMTAANRESIAEAEAEHKLRFLDLDGPVFELAGVRVRGLFQGTDGRHWADGDLFVESSRSWSREAGDRADWIVDAAAGADLSFDLLVATPARGLHMGSIAAIDDLAELGGLDVCVARPGWARTWTSFGWQSDREASAIAEVLPDVPLFSPSTAVRRPRRLATVPIHPRGDA